MAQDRVADRARRSSAKFPFALAPCVFTTNMAARACGHGPVRSIGSAAAAVVSWVLPNFCPRGLLAEPTRGAHRAHAAFLYCARATRSSFSFVGQGRSSAEAHP